MLKICTLYNKKLVTQIYIINSRLFCTNIYDKLTKQKLTGNPWLPCIPGVPCLPGIPSKPRSPFSPGKPGRPSKPRSPNKNNFHIKKLKIKKVQIYLLCLNIWDENNISNLIIYIPNY